MKCLTKLALASAISMGLATMANADHAVTNGDAETMDLTGWTADPEVTVTQGEDINFQVDSGDPGNDGGYFFDFAGSPVGEDGSATMSQSVTLYPCGAFDYLEGDVSVDYIYSTGPGDTADGAISFDGGAAADENLGDTSEEAWTAGDTLTSSVPLGAMMLDISFTGNENPEPFISTGVVANVGIDDVTMATSGCPSEFAKISGKVVAEDGPKRGIGSVAGAIGFDHEDGSLIGEIFLNWKAERWLCTFTPSDLPVNDWVGDIPGLDTNPSAPDDVAALVEGTVTCTDYDLDPTAVTDANFAALLVAKDPQDNNKNKDKDRGFACFAIQGFGDQGCWELTHGNVIVNSDTSDG